MIRCRFTISEGSSYVVSTSCHFLRCSKQIHEEATDILYGDNYFNAEHRVGFHVFKKKVGERSFNRIHHFALITEGMRFKNSVEN